MKLSEMSDEESDSEELTDNHQPSKSSILDDFMRKFSCLEPEKQESVLFNFVSTMKSMGYNVSIEKLKSESAAINESTSLSPKAM